MAVFHGWFLFPLGTFLAAALMDVAGSLVVADEPDMYVSDGAADEDGEKVFGRAIAACLPQTRVRNEVWLGLAGVRGP